MSLTVDGPQPPVVWVVGVSDDDRADSERFRTRLAHGADPVRVLRAAGWEASPKSVVAQADPHELTLVFELHEATAVRDETVPPPEDPGLVLEPGEVPLAYQRVAVYAFVRSARGVLLTQNSALTNSPGTWVLPGGGLDPGELPDAAAHREIWEETGQRVELGAFSLVSTRHWVGRAPSGRLEDFHAVRLVFAATCPDPSDPVVHDVGGTTAAAQWFTPAEIEGLALTPSWRHPLTSLLT